VETIKQVLVTGGAGYVGSVLVPELLSRGYRVKVIDLYLYGENVLDQVSRHPHLIQIKGDIRDHEMLKREIPGSDAVIHLACISNDPSYELDPELGKSINYDAFVALVDYSKSKGTKRFIYASSSSVYGIKHEREVTEDLSLEPLTDYSKFKALCEEVLIDQGSDDFVTTAVRPATVCGYSPRMRLDLTVNILTNHAVNKGQITVFGGKQMRPNLHISDMCRAYLHLLEQEPEKINKNVYNVGYQNYSVREIAELVRKTLDPSIPIEVSPTNDERSYHVCSRKIKEELGFEARHSIEAAVMEIKQAFDRGRIPDPLTDIKYYNIRTMQSLNLK